MYISLFIDFSGRSEKWGNMLRVGQQHLVNLPFIGHLVMLIATIKPIQKLHSILYYIQHTFIIH